MLLQSENLRSTEELIAVIGELKSRGVLSEYLDWGNVLMLMLVVGITVLAGFVFVHMCFERLFWRKFYQQVRVGTAVRRGLLLDITLAMLFFFNINAAEWYMYLLGVMFMLIVEVLLTKTFQGELEQLPDTSSWSKQVEWLQGLIQKFKARAKVEESEDA